VVVDWSRPGRAVVGEECRQGDRTEAVGAPLERFAAAYRGLVEQ
jgi:hypothetical protein